MVRVDIFTGSLAATNSEFAKRIQAYLMENLRKNQIEKTRKMSEDIAGSSRSAQSLWSSLLVGTPDIAMTDPVTPRQMIGLFPRQH
ncbi:hypothetical protein L0Y49_05110, partial [bacterium]|nr:hypothetical protein [bacterium]